MDLSIDIGFSQKQIRAENSNPEEDFASMQDLEEILDLSGLDLDNEETWLYTPSNPSSNNQDWFSEKPEPLRSQFPSEYSISKLKSTKTIDTRTFTRPKKKIARPSINDIEQMYFSDDVEMNSSTEERNSGNKFPHTVQEEQEISEPLKPLQFDLSQPTSLHNFDSFLFNSANTSSFQNMSPPSLVNSLCSSTFTNLMESSFIKNDPILREIRDKDFTETALLQDMETPLFQSITESCSSLNSDVAESFLKKVTRNSTFRKDVSGLDNSTLVLEKSFEGSNGSSIGANVNFEVVDTIADSDSNNVNTTYPLNSPVTRSKQDSPNSSSSSISFGNPNGTYRRVPKNNGTFRRSDLKNNRLSLNLTYNTSKDTTNALNRETSKSIENDMNNSNKGSSDDLRTRSSGKTVIVQGDSMEELKRRCSSSEGSGDLNRLSYCQEEEKDLINITFKEDKISSELNRTVEVKRSSLGSADSLDRMSSLSSSSKGSSKVLSVEDVEAIVEMQERSLSLVMSTPKAVLGRKNLWDHNFVSPIVTDAKDTLSDSELSDEYKSVKSQLSPKVSIETWKKPSAKSLGYLAVSKDMKAKSAQRSSYTLSGPKPLQALPTALRGSYSNISSLKTTTSTLGGSQQNLYRPPRQINRPAPLSTNLKTMGSKLKGSYTSLKPISANLPVVPPIVNTLNGTQTITRASKINNLTVTKTTKSEVPKVLTNQRVDETFIKPQVTKMSGLPRPTGIPRPASRIPGPRPSNARSSSSRNLNN